MFNDLDVVRATRDLTPEIKRHCIGTVVFVHSDPYEAYEVEFFDDTHTTLDVLTVESDDIEPRN